jgi:hypothetical protein
MRTRKLFRLGATLVVALGAVSLWTEIVWAQEQIAIYRVLPTQVTREAVLKLAREAFGMESPQVSEDSVAFVLRQEQKILQVRKSGAFTLLFSDDAKLLNPRYRPSLPSQQEALRLAEEFLQKHDLLPKGFILATGIFNLTEASIQYVTDEQGEAIPNHWALIFPFLVYTKFPPQLGLELTGAPAVAKVLMGHQGEIIGLELSWRDIDPTSAQHVRLFSPQEALELLREKLGLPDLPDDPHVADWPTAAAYYGGPPDANPAYLYPVYTYLLPGWAVEPGHIIPATEFSPLAIIQEPKAEAVFREGQPISFRSRVRFGSPPYRYRWLAFGRGELSQASTFRTTLPPGRYLITLEVTDRNGLSNSHTIPIEVQPRPTASSSLPSPWVLVLAGLVGLGGFWPRSRRWLLVGLLCGGLALIAPNQLNQPTYAFQGQPRQYGPGNQVFWKINKVEISADDGVVFQGLTWKVGVSVAAHISVPWLKVTVHDPKAGKDFEYRLELKAADKPKEFDIAIHPQGCPQPVGRRVGAAYTVSHTDAATNIQFSLDVTQSLILYWPDTNCGRYEDSALSAAPEFYPEVYVRGFKAKQPANLQLKKVRVPIRIDFDPAGPSNNWVLVVKEPAVDGLDVLGWKNYYRRNIPQIPFISQGGTVLISLPLPCPKERPPQGYRGGRQGWIICTDKEIRVEKFDHYYQGVPVASTPLCLPLKAIGACAQVHLRHPDNVSWEFVAVDNKADEDEKEPATYVTGDALTNAVFWYVADWSPKEKETEYRFFSDQGVELTIFMRPFQWSGLTCGFLIC